jgi:hypothetical protein
MTTATEIPHQIEAIYLQIGGHRAMAMAFSGWSYSTEKTSATFTIAPALKRQTRDNITHIRVTLTEMDTYVLEFLSVSKAWPAGREVSRLTDAYAEDLRRAVEMRTGLMLSMGTMGQKQSVAL